jgi:hypothetical protein
MKHFTPWNEGVVRENRVLLSFRLPIKLRKNSRRCGG